MDATHFFFMFVLFATSSLYSAHNSLIVCEEMFTDMVISGSEVSPSPWVLRAGSSRYLEKNNFLRLSQEDKCFHK